MSPYLKDGERVRHDRFGRAVTLDKNGEVVEDGTRVRVPMVMMDAAKKEGEDKTPTFDASVHRPRAGVRSMEQRARVDATRIMNERRTQDAWKEPKTAGEIAAVVKELEQEAHAAPENAYARSVERIGTANSKAPADYAEPGKAHQRMVERQQNAWKNPKT